MIPRIYVFVSRCASRSLSAAAVATILVIGCSTTVLAQSTLTVTVEVPDGVSKAGLVTGTGEISCDPTCSATIENEDTVRLEAHPPAEHFVVWQDCPQFAGNLCMFEISSDVSITVTIKPNYPLTISIEGEGGGRVESDVGGINCNAEELPQCTTEFPHGIYVTLTATADEFSVFDGWSSPGCSGANPCVVLTTTAHEVTAIFAKSKHILRVRHIGAIGSVRIRHSDAEFRCGQVCDLEIPHGEQVELLAIANYTEFRGWSDVCSGDSTACTFDMNGDRLVTAHFEQHPKVGSFWDNLGYGIGITFETKDRKRVRDVEVDENGIVQGTRVHEQARLVLEYHVIRDITQGFLDGYFVAVITGLSDAGVSDRVVEGAGFGYLWGLQHLRGDGDEKVSLNVGLGIFVENEAEYLRRGVSLGKRLPNGVSSPTERSSAAGVIILLSFDL